MNKIKLQQYRSMLSTNQDSFLNLDFVHTNKEIPQTEIVKNIDLNDVYLQEMNASNRYRFSFTINGMFTNILTNITGEDSLSTFNTEIFKAVNSPLNQQGFHYKTNITYKQSVESHLRIENGWVGYYRPNGLSVDCNLVELKPKKSDLCFINSNRIKNWDFGLFYIKSKRQPFLGHIGLPITHIDTVDYNGRVLYRFFSPFKHNLNIGDTVNIGNIGSLSGNYVVIDLGNDTNEHKEQMFVVDLPSAPSLTANTNIRRVVNGVVSEYYLRIVDMLEDIDGEKLNQNSYLLSEIGFANNVYGDSFTQLVFNKDIDLTDFKDHRSRPITEVFVGCVKKKFGGIYTNVQSGYDISYNNYYSNSIADARRLNGDTTPIMPLETNIDLLSSTELILDFVEYNEYELKEYVISDILHRFNTQNRVNGGTLVTGEISFGDYLGTISLGSRKEGYMYKPFKKIIIREESEYIEKATGFDIVPEYAVEYSPLKYSWRDIYDKTSSSIKYPFLNGCHYINNRFDFLLMRQDPFGNYGLLYRQFPKDQVGSVNRLKPQFIQTNNNYDEC